MATLLDPTSNEQKFSKLNSAAIVGATTADSTRLWVRVYQKGLWTLVVTKAPLTGDLVRLAPGDRIPADLRLVEAVNLKVNEAALTGESDAVGKTTVPLTDPDLGVGDRVNLAYSGTDVTYGRGQGVAVATGL